MAEYRANLGIKSNPMTCKIALTDGPIVSEMTLRQGSVVRGMNVQQLPLRFAVEVENEIAVIQSMNPICYAIADGNTMSFASVFDAESLLRMYSKVSNDIGVKSSVNACRGISPGLNETVFSIVESPLATQKGVLGAPETNRVLIAATDVPTSAYVYPSAATLSLAVEAEVIAGAEKYVSDTDAVVGVACTAEGICRGKLAEYGDSNIGVGITCEFVCTNFIQDIDALGNGGVGALDSLTLNELEYD